MIQLRRPRRARSNAAIRDLLAENRLSAHDFLAPLFVIEGQSLRIPIATMPGQFRFSLDLLLEEIQELISVGVRGICLFPALSDQLKTSDAREALNEDGLYLRAIETIKKTFPDLLLMTDVALDPYSSDGHDGLVDPGTGEILNDETTELLAKMSVVQAKAGADIIGPSDMMDGRIQCIRHALEENHFHKTLIMSYCAKYASSFYGPFRDALDSAPKEGDKKTYQMNPANKREALLELHLDEQEGADILMVKPGLPYLDVLSEMRHHTQLPLAAYHVSGEYAMVMAAAEKGMVDAQECMMECLMSFKRAGADLILTYYAKEAARLLSQHG